MLPCLVAARVASVSFESDQALRMDIKAVQRLLGHRQTGALLGPLWDDSHYHQKHQRSWF